MVIWTGVHATCMGTKMSRSTVEWGIWWNIIICCGPYRKKKYNILGTLAFDRLDLALDPFQQLQAWSVDLPE